MFHAHPTVVPSDATSTPVRSPPEIWLKAGCGRLFCLHQSISLRTVSNVVFQSGPSTSRYEPVMFLSFFSTASWCEFSSISSIFGHAQSTFLMNVSGVCETRPLLLAHSVQRYKHQSQMFSKNFYASSNARSEYSWLALKSEPVGMNVANSRDKPNGAADLPASQLMKSGMLLFGWRVSSNSIL